MNSFLFIFLEYKLSSLFFLLLMISQSCCVNKIVGVETQIIFKCYINLRLYNYYRQSQKNVFDYKSINSLIQDVIWLNLISHQYDFMLKFFLKLIKIDIFDELIIISSTFGNNNHVLFIKTSEYMSLSKWII